MGRVRTSSRKTNKNKQYKKAHCTARRPRDIDQIQDDLKEEAKNGQKLQFAVDDDLPGLGQHYCTPCARHFITDQSLQHHLLSKLHKRRMKDVKQPQYSHTEANWAAGIGKEELPTRRQQENASVDIEDEELS